MLIYDGSSRRKAEMHYCYACSHYNTRDLILWKWHIVSSHSNDIVRKRNLQFINRVNKRLVTRCRNINYINTTGLGQHI
jgi:hypothetical protein